MVISDDPNYEVVLKGIAKHLLENQVQSLLMGRKSIIKFWLDNCNEALGKPLGPLSTKILSDDVDAIITKIYSVDFE